MDFKNYLSVTSGTATIRYPLSILFSGSIPLTIEAVHLAVEPEAELIHALGQQSVLFDRIRGKLIIGPNREISIDYLDAESKTIQFHLGPKGSRESV